MTWEKWLKVGQPKDETWKQTLTVAALDGLKVGKAAKAPTFLDKAWKAFKNLFASRPQLATVSIGTIRESVQLTSKQQAVVQRFAGSVKSGGAKVAQTITDLSQSFENVANITRENVAKLLKFSEEGFGHTIQKHVGKSDEFLIDRVQDNIKQKATGGVLEVKPATTFTDLATAEKAVRDALQSPQGTEAIKKVINKSRLKEINHTESFVVDLGRDLGRGFELVNSDIKKINGQISKISVTLKSDAKGGFEILTSLPIK
jgi:hypothetical protein